MKKFLSLVLALVMTMSLVTVSAGAKDFTDNSKITYEEAVDVMSAVKVIDGYTDGSFNPTATLTRGAAAKIICNLILGPTTASALVADAAPYSDVATDNVFAGYIAYCQKTGIISGYADGTFRPGNSLTGYAFMKMLLGALGYDAAKEGYTGDNWSIAVAKRALNVGLADDLASDFNGTKAVTREEACLYAFNTLKATMVEYENDTTITAGNVTVSTSSKASEMYNGAQTETIKDDNKMQFAEKYFTKLKMSPTSDDFGRPATKWMLKNEKIGTYADTPDLTYTTEVKGKVIWSDLGEPKVSKANFTNKLNGETGSYNETDIAKNQNATGSSADGVVTEVYWDADYTEGAAEGELIIVSYNYWLVKADEDYDDDDEEVAVTPKANIDLSDNGVLSADDFAVEDVKEDDYLVITGVVNDEDDIVVKTVAPATKVENVVVSKARNEDYVVADGTSYNYSAVSYDDDKAMGYDLMTDSSKYDINDDGYDLYLDPNGYVLGIEGYDAGNSLNDYLFVKALSSNGFDKIAKVVFMDGSKKTVIVDKLNDDDVDDQNVKIENGFYTFDVDSDGNYELTTVKTFKVTGTIDSAAKPISGSNRTGTSATVFIADGKVYTGVKNAPSVKTSGDVYFTLTDNGTLEAVYTENSGVSTNSADEYVYILNNNPARMKDGDDVYFVYDAVVNGEKTTLDANDNKKAAGLYKVESYTDNRADLGIVITAADGDLVAAVSSPDAVSYSDGTITLGSDFTTADNYLLADDVTIITVDSNTVKTISTASIEKQFGKDFDTLYLIQTSSSNKDICTIYMVK